MFTLKHRIKGKWVCFCNFVFSLLQLMELTVEYMQFCIDSSLVQLMKLTVEYKSLRRHLVKYPFMKQFYIKGVRFICKCIEMLLHFKTSRPQCNIH